MSIRTSVGQVALVGGSRSDRPSQVLVDERASRSSKARRRGNLYALIELSGLAAERDVVARQLLNVVRDTYYAYRGSVTAGLQEAVRTVNDWLFRENRNALPHEQRTAGLSCAVLRDSDLFIAQAGPAAVYLAHEGAVTRFPDDSPWLDGTPLEDTDAAPLGERRDLNVALFHTQVAEGDTILLVESAYAHRLPARALPHILAGPSVDDMVDDLVAVGGGADLVALVIQVREAAAVSLPVVSPVQREARVERRVPARRAAAAAGRWDDRVQVHEGLRKAVAGLGPALAGLGAALATLLRRLLPGQVIAQQPRAARAAPAPRKGVTAAQRPRQPAPARPWWEPVRKILIGLAVAIPIGVALFVLVMYIQRGAKQKAELEALWQSANQSWQQAALASDTAAIREQLGAAQAALDQLVTRQPDNAQAVALRRQVQARLDEVNGVKRISLVNKLRSYPAGAKLTRVIVEGEHIFVLDRNAGRVYHHKLDRFQQALVPETKDTVVVSKGQTVGDLIVGDLVDMTWVPVGEGRQQSNLVILESNDALLQYEPTTGQLTRIQVAATDAWKFPRLVGSYYGRFYVLDPSANKIWRYAPTPDGYSSAPDDWLRSEVDLMGVVDMAIGDSIYLLYADGQIRRLTTGEPDRFDMSSWDVLPSNPGALFTRPPDEVHSVFLADRGNGRIVQSDLDGRFERQYKLQDTSAESTGDALSGVVSLFVNEINSQAYFTSGQDLYLVALPEPGS